MKPVKQKALAAAGWKVGEAADFLGMNAEERQLFEARAQLALAIRRQREVLDMTQKDSDD